MSPTGERLRGSVAIVTGGAQGLGEAIARRLATEGARVVVADLNREGAEAAAGRLRDEGHEALGVALDVGERASVRAAVEQAVEAFGRLDVIFNNAGFNRPLPFMETDADNFNAIMRVNAIGVLHGIQEAARRMIEQGGGGRIVNTASIAGRQGYPDFASYCASKAAVISLTQAAARALAPHRIRVNAMAPGVVRTPLWDRLEQDMVETGQIAQKGEYIESFSASILTGGPAKPDDLAGVAAFLASADSDQLTGQVIMCDGGMVLV
jgi:meso-butanediol dehydrogenase / (S,S)-butanediol dehydrogenase / diacetyl reductase